MSRIGELLFIILGILVLGSGVYVWGANDISSVIPSFDQAGLSNLCPPEIDWRPLLGKLAGAVLVIGGASIAWSAAQSFHRKAPRGKHG